MNRIHSLFLLPLLALAACESTSDASDPTGSPGPDEAPFGEDLPLGELSEADAKADGNWTHALQCKPVPDLPRLEEPEIFISLDGLTLRLVDHKTGFEKVFPIGAGEIDRNASSRTFGESLSYWPLAYYRKQTFEITPRTIQPCKIWWTDSSTGKRLPVFAGMPFLSWSGNYGIHGPIDNYNAPNGGNLRRGYVSHGCIRMESADVLELYARIKGVARVPVQVQREPERDAAGRRIDVEQKWVGAECEADDDCNFDGGICKLNRYGGRGYCTARCDRFCADMPGQPTTFCVPDPDDAAQGMCVSKLVPQNPDCRAFDHFVPRRLGRFSQPEVKGDVCMPGSRGWVGNQCFGDRDCADGLACAGATDGAPGLCTQACTRTCPDQPGFPTTRCAEDDALGATCLSECTPESNGSECAAGTECVSRPRAGFDDRFSYVCAPRR